MAIFVLLFEVLSDFPTFSEIFTKKCPKSTFMLQFFIKRAKNVRRRRTAHPHLGQARFDSGPFLRQPVLAVFEMVLYRATVIEVGGGAAC